MQRREIWIAYLLLFFGGVVGIHQFYLNRIGWGILYLFTGGLFFIGVIVDCFTLPMQVRACNRKMGLADQEPVGRIPITPAWQNDLMQADLKLRDFTRRLNNLESIINRNR